MCNAANAVIVRDIVYTLVDQHKMFTAWDVTKEAKARGADEQHRHLKHAVHEMFSNGEMQSNGYTRSLAQNMNVSPQPWIYHSVTDDPNAYADQILDGSTAPVDGVATTPVSSNSDDEDEDAASITRMIDKDGRLCIPKPFLVSLKLAPGSMVDVFVNFNYANIEVCPHDASLLPDATYSVNKDGRVRISKKVLSSQRASWTIELRQGATADHGIDRVVIK